MSNVDGSSCTGPSTDGCVQKYQRSSIS
ncbi:hypothetical protein FG05_35245 [Fusarium graminearum]|nr:hypothetical protein FG05_35245 [Fusarium graminearum]